MTKSLFFIVLSAAVISGSMGAIGRADGLFSRVSMDSAFSRPANTTEKAPMSNDGEAPEHGRRVLSLGELTDLLSAAGLEPQNNDDKFVSLKFEHAAWKFPVAISISPDYERIHVSFFLVQLDAQKQPSGDRLLALLGANRKLQPAFFSYIEERKQIELSSSFPNGQVGPKMLREVLENLSKVAEETASIWDLDGKSAANLVGKWSAARSANEAFALQLNADGSFILVSVKDSKQSRSTGRFSLNAGQLMLTTGDGGKLAGSLGNLSADVFEFTPPGSAGKLTFTRAR